jgi:hypothetical protein
MSTDTDNKAPAIDPLDMVWGAAAIGRQINRTPRQAFYLLENGQVPGARKFGRQWACASKTLRRVLDPTEG